MRSSVAFIFFTLLGINIFLVEFFIFTSSVEKGVAYNVIPFQYFYPISGFHFSHPYRHKTGYRTGYFPVTKHFSTSSRRQ